MCGQGCAFVNKIHWFKNFYYTFNTNLTLKIPDGPDSGPVDPIRVHDSCTYFEKMLGTIGYESGSNMGVFRFLTSQGIQNNLDPDRVHSRT